MKALTIAERLRAIATRSNNGDSATLKEIANHLETENACHACLLEDQQDKKMDSVMRPGRRGEPLRK